MKYFYWTKKILTALTFCLLIKEMGKSARLAEKNVQSTVLRRKVNEMEIEKLMAKKKEN